MSSEETTPRHESKRMGRPRVYAENRLSTTVIFSESVMRALNAVTTNKSAYIERVLRERPEIATRLTPPAQEQKEEDRDTTSNV